MNACWISAFSSSIRRGFLGSVKKAMLPGTRTNSASPYMPSASATACGLSSSSVAAPTIARLYSAARAALFATRSRSAVSPSISPRTKRSTAGAIALEIVGPDGVDVGDDAVGRLGRQQDARALHRVLGPGAYGAVRRERQRVRNDHQRRVHVLGAHRRRGRVLGSRQVGHPLERDVARGEAGVGEDLGQVVDVRSERLERDRLAAQILHRADAFADDQRVAAGRPRHLIDDERLGARIARRRFGRHVDHAERSAEVGRAPAQIGVELPGEDVFTDQAQL